MSTVLDLAIMLSLSDRASSGVQNIISQFNLLRGATQEVQNQMNRLRTMAWGGGALAAIGGAGLLATAGAATVAVSKAGDLQEVMTEIKSMTFGTDLFDPTKADMITEKMKEIEALTTRLGLETTFSNIGAGQAIIELQKGGIQYQDIIGGAAEATIKFAQLNKMAPEAAAELMVQTRAGFQLTGQQMLDAADTVTKVAASSSASAEDINRGLGNMAGVASQMWKTRSKAEQVFDSSALVALTRTQTPEGSSAGTFVRNFLERLVPQTNRQTEAMAEAGWLDNAGKSVFLDYSKDPRGQLKSAKEIADILRKTVGGAKIILDEEEIEKQFELAEQGMGTDKLIKLFHKVFGQQGGRTAYTLLRTGEGSLEEIQSNYEKQLSLNERVRLQMQNFNQVLDTAKESWSTFLTALGTPLLAGATNLFAGIADKLAIAAYYFKEHPQVSKYMFAIAGGVSAFLAIGGAVLVAAASFGALKLALVNAGISFKTIALASGGIVLGIVAIAGATYLIYKNWDTIGPYAKAVWEYVRESVASAWEWLKTNIGPVASAVWENISAAWGGVSSFFREHREEIERFLGFTREAGKMAGLQFMEGNLSFQLPGWLKLLIGGLILDKSVGALTSLGSAAQRVFRLFNIFTPLRLLLGMAAGLERLRGLVPRVLSVFTKLPGVTGLFKIFEVIQRVGYATFGNLSLLIQRIGPVISRAISVVGRFGVSLLRLGTRSLIAAGRMAAAWFIALGPIGWIIAGVTVLIVAGVAAWKTNFMGFRDKVTAVWNWIKEHAITAWQGIKDTINTVMDWLKGLPARAIEWGSNLITSFVNGIESKLSTIPDALKKAANTIKSWLGISSPTEEGPLRYNHLWGGNLMKSIAGGMLNNIGLIHGASAVVAQAMAVRGYNASQINQFGVSGAGLSPASRGIVVQGPVVGEIKIYQQPGENSDVLVQRIKRELGFSVQHAGLTQSKFAFSGVD